MPRSSPAAEPLASRARLLPALGTYVRLSAQGPAACLELALAAAAAEIAAVERSMSFHRADSTLHELHRAEPGREFVIDAGLWSVLELARQLWTQSGGLFDPTLAPRLVASGALPRPDAPPAAPGADFGDVELPAPGRVRLRRRVWLDLGGIAKGHAVDRALDGLRRAGLVAGSVNAGGDLACFGATEQVALRDPRAPTRLCGALALTDAALATSGDYFQPGRLRGRRGAALRRRAGSVSVLAPNCALADGLTKIVWAAPRRAAPLLAAHGARALILEPGHDARWL